jgi:hypothetical protein
MNQKISEIRANLFGPGYPASRGGFFAKLPDGITCVFTKHQNPFPGHELGPVLTALN